MEKKHFANINLYWIIIFFIFIFTFILKIWAVSDYNFALTYDQGRDLMEIRSIVIGHRPALVGPTTSINGLYLGPFLFYFNIIPFILGQGNPSALLYWQILWYQLAGLAFGFVFRKTNPTFGIISATLFLLMPTGFSTNRYFWSANLMPIITAFFLITLLIAFKKPTKKKLFILGLLTGIALQIEAAFGILFLPLTIFTLTKLKRTKYLYLFSGFILTIIPQIIYELRHQFIMSQTLINHFTGKNPILGQNLPFYERLLDRYNAFSRIIHNTNYMTANFTTILIIIAIIYLISKRKKLNKNSQQLFAISINLILLALTFYLIFPQKLKSWYLDGLTIPFILLISLFLSELVNSTSPHLPTQTKKRSSITKLITQIGVITIITLTLFFTTKKQFKYINQSQTIQSNDPSNLSNQIKTIDWVYQQANNQGFQVYNYLPSVYDYAYNYIFWWYGTKTYGYQPTKVTYADNIPQYIKSNQKLWTKTKPTNINSPTFLIVEPDPESSQRQTDWLTNFKKFCINKKQTFFWSTTVQLRYLCSKTSN